MSQFMWLLPLTNTTTCVLLDKDDYLWAKQHKWYSKCAGYNWYPARSVRHGRHVSTVYLHREIMSLHNSLHDGHHKDGNTFNATRANLEVRITRPHKRGL